MAWHAGRLMASGRLMTWASAAARTATNGPLTTWRCASTAASRAGGDSMSNGAGVGGAGIGAGSGAGVGARTLFVHVKPAPASLAERRSVLRVLERYGRAELFKKRADNGAFLLVASSASMASALVQRSPLQYEFLAATWRAAQPWGQPRVATAVEPIETTAASRGSEGKGSEDREASSQGAASGPPLAHRSFVLSVFPSHDYHHRTAIRSSPLHGPWPRDDDDVLSTSAAAAASNADTYKHTFVYNALKAVVPESAASEALCDWRRRAHIGGGGGGGGGDRSGGDGLRGGEAAARGVPSEDRRQRSLAATIARIRERRARRAQASKAVLARARARERAAVEAAGDKD